MATRLSYLHPYPAMVADPLAEDLVSEFVVPGMEVLDPFCGTGRLLIAAADAGADCVGVDVNPLAFLLFKAKTCAPEVSALNNALDAIADSGNNADLGPLLDFHTGRKVSWFSERVSFQLSGLIRLINGLPLGRDEMLILAAILSATAREVSYCRKDRWKLHRLSIERRANFSASPVLVFKRRLGRVIGELQAREPIRGHCDAILGDCQHLYTNLKRTNGSKLFDLVLTSPPYGDSRTTVQYGGVSSICLGVVSHLNGFCDFARLGGEIDNSCLGGRPTQGIDIAKSLEIYHDYWHGGRHNPQAAKTLAYFQDLALACEQIGQSVRKGGLAIFIVGRRRTGGWRVYIDRLIEDHLRNLGFLLLDKRRRRIKRKMLPRLVRPWSRAEASLGDSGATITTIASEIVLVFKRISLKG